MALGQVSGRYYSVAECTPLQRPPLPRGAAVNSSVHRRRRHRYDARARVVWTCYLPQWLSCPPPSGDSGATHWAGAMKGGGHPRQLHCIRARGRSVRMLYRRSRGAVGHISAATRAMSGPGVLRSIRWLMNWFALFEFRGRPTCGFLIF